MHPNLATNPEAKSNQKSEAAEFIGKAIYYPHFLLVGLGKQAVVIVKNDRLILRTAKDELVNAPINDLEFKAPRFLGILVIYHAGKRYKLVFGSIDSLSILASGSVGAGVIAGYLSDGPASGGLKATGVATGLVASASSTDLLNKFLEILPTDKAQIKGATHFPNPILVFSILLAIVVILIFTVEIYALIALVILGVLFIGYAVRYILP